jgi:hypothetical protein
MMGYVHVVPGLERTTDGLLDFFQFPYLLELNLIRTPVIGQETLLSLISLPTWMLYQYLESINSSRFVCLQRASEDRIPPSDGIICLLGSLDNQYRSNSDVETSRIPILDLWEKLWLGQIGHTGCKRVAA